MKRRQFLWRAVPLLALLVLILGVLTFEAQPLSSPLSAPTQQQDLIAANRQQSRVMQALYLVEAQAAVSGWTPMLARTAGDLWRQAGDMVNAAAYWEIAARTQPPDTALLRQLAQTYLDLQRWALAADTLERLVSAGHGQTWAHYQLGMLRAAFDPQTAISHLESAATEVAFNALANALLRVLMGNADDPLISARVGQVFVEYRLWAYAELAFAHAAIIGQPFAEALAYTGFVRERQGKDGSAWIEQALSLASDNAQVRYLQGLHLRARGDMVESVAALVEAVALQPANPLYCAELGRAYQLIGDVTNAALWLQQAVILSGSAPEFQQLLGLFYAQEALTLAVYGVDAQAQIAALTPQDPDVLAELAWSLYSVGEAAGAQNQIDAALALDSSNARALYYRARILLDGGDTLAALALLQQVAASESEFAEQAQRILSSLGG